MTSPAPPALGFMWLELTGRCQLACLHCYADSGPTGTDGTMAYDDWIAAIDQAAALGVGMVQMIGGEPTLYAGLPGLIAHARARAVEVEVYSNLVHVTEVMWGTLSQPGVRLATSYYTDDPAQHRQITGRGSTLHRTRSNIAQAVAMGIPIRVGLIDLGEGQRIAQAQEQLADLGVTNMSVDRMRILGRPARGVCDASELCGNCGDGIAAILPDGRVTPCPLGRWLTAGSIKDRPLAELAPRVQAIAAAGWEGQEDSSAAWVMRLRSLKTRDAWAQVIYRPGKDTHVSQSGAGLWNVLEEAYMDWLQHKRPGPGSYRLIVTPNGQDVWGL